MVGGKRRNLRKSLRDAYNDALLRANLTQEIKDTLFGHKREGAKEKYAISQATIIDAYNKAFQFLAVNHGAQASKDIEVMRQQVAETKEMLLKTSQDQQKQIIEIRNLVLFQMKEKKIDRTEVKRLIQELNEKDKETEQ
jgi:hypothetical protein